MPEQTIWTGTSSQVRNFFLFLACILIIPIPFAIWAWLVTKNRVYTLTNERFVIRSGVLNKATESLELYRVRDLQVREPLWKRMWGLCDIHLITTDSTTPQLVLDYVSSSSKLAELLREHVEICRQRRGAREIGVDIEAAGEHSGDQQIL